MLKIHPSFRFLLSYVFKYKYSYLLGIVFILLTNYILASIPIRIKEIIDFMYQGVNPSQNVFLQAVGWAIFLTVAVVGVRTLSRIFFFNTARKIEFEVKNQLFEKITRLPREYFMKNLAGKIISQINNDTIWIRLLCGFGLMQLVNIFSAFSIIPYKMWQISPTVTIYTIITLIVLFSGIHTGIIYSMKFYLKRIKCLQQLSNSILSSLNGLEVIRSCDLQDWSKEHFAKQNQELYQNSIKASRIRSLFSPILNNTDSLLKALIFFVGGIYFFEGNFTIGDITAMISYTAFLTPPLASMGWFLNVLLQGRLGLQSVYSIFAQENAYNTKDKQKLEQVKKELAKGIRFKNLNFCYPEDKESAVLKNLNFSIKKGQVVGVLGSVGSGKTTLARCLNKYVSAPRGSIFIGNLDIEDIDYRILRKLIRSVTQDSFLFSDTVANNILFGARTEQILTKAEWRTIFEKSALTNELKIFPKKKETLIGEKGIMLSGGQKQRISFARSMLENCELLILDNIMSALDYETENILLKTIIKKEHSSSVLIISHRARVLSHADYILVLEQGKIVEKGTFKELLEKKGYLYKTWKIQDETK